MNTEIIKKTITNLYKEKNEADNKINLNIEQNLTHFHHLLGHNSSNNETLEKSIDNYASLEKSIGSILGETLLAPVLSNLDSKTNTSFWRNNFRSSLQTTLPDGVKPIVDNIKSNSILDIALLGVGIVDNQEKAFQLQNKLSFGQALTTLEGGLWRWDGFVQPPEVQNSYSERLQKLAKLRTLENEIPPLEKKQKSIEKIINENETFLKEIEKYILELEKEISELIEKNNNLNILNTKIESKLSSSKILIKSIKILLMSPTKNSDLLNAEELVNSSNLPHLLAEELEIRTIVTRVEIH